jgi:glycosyltransferase involved in cell wall biosynthesis
VRVCLISLEIFAWGKYGGFGRATRAIGRELVRRGVEVFAVVPRRQGQRERERLDGMTVLSFPPSRPWRAAALLRECDADIYHSQEPSLATWQARRAMPGRKHIVTFRDPRSREDWLTELRHPSLHPLQVAANYLYEENPLVRSAARRADRHFCAAAGHSAKIAAKYGLPAPPPLLPTPIPVPEEVTKALEPTVCFVARWDRRKRPELFLQLAERFPAVRFIAVGRARDPEVDRGLRDRYGHLPNLEMPGLIDQFASDALAAILSRSWVLVNTAAREGLPNAFLEAAAHGCAVLSAVDPEGFTSRFGRRVEGDDFAGGLEWLLGNGRWKELGCRGRHYVQETFEAGAAVDKHVVVYEEVLGRGSWAVRAEPPLPRTQDP